MRSRVEVGEGDTVPKLPLLLCFVLFSKKKIKGARHLGENKGRDIRA